MGSIEMEQMSHASGSDTVFRVQGRGGHSCGGHLDARMHGSLAPDRSGCDELTSSHPSLLKENQRESTIVSPEGKPVKKKMPEVSNDKNDQPRVDYQAACGLDQPQHPMIKIPKPRKHELVAGDLLEKLWYVSKKPTTR